MNKLLFIFRNPHLLEIISMGTSLNSILHHINTFTFKKNANKVNGDIFFFSANEINYVKRREDFNPNDLT